MAVNILMGTVLGILTGLGIGGGSLLMLYLTLWLRLDPVTARGINLLFFLPSAVVACCFRRKQGVLNWKKLLSAMTAGCAAAVLGITLSAWLPLGLLKKLFGGLLLITGVKELRYGSKKQPSP